MVPDSAAMQSAAMQATRHARRIYVGGIGNVDEKVRHQYQGCVELCLCV